MGERESELDALIAEQIAYYDARAREYDASLRALERYISLGGNVVGANQLGESEQEIATILDAIEALPPLGDVLEIACGTGWWTQWLARNSNEVTAIDASGEMLALNRERVGQANVHYILADALSWNPDRRYGLVFFGFWLSHVPLDRFDRFWETVKNAVTPGGRVFFIDELEREWEHETRLEGDAVLRSLENGRQFRAIKVFHRPEELELRLRQRGWQAHVEAAGRRFYWGLANTIGQR